MANIMANTMANIMIIYCNFIIFDFFDYNLCIFINVFDYFDFLDFLNE
jgi:hypothetical protein